MQLLQSVRDVLFPPICITCGAPLSACFSTLCENCVQGLHLLDQEGRCARCFCEKEDHAPCSVCRSLPGKLRQQAACFEESPVSTQLVGLMKHGIALSAVAGYMAVQLEKLHFPLPDLIVPTPGDWFEKDAWNLRKALCKELSLILQKPTSFCIHLQRHLFPLRHEPLERQPTFTNALRSSQDATNKVVLLIHDKLSTGRAIALSTQSLENMGVHAVYALSLLIAVE